MSLGPARPLRVLDVDLAGPVVDLVTDGANGQSDAPQGVWVLVRQAGEPLGFLELDVPPGGIGGDELHARARAAVADRRSAPGRDCEVGRLHTEHLTQAPALTVVVCTREQPEGLRRCLLSLAAQDHPDLEVLVVDNAPRTTATREVVDGLSASSSGPARLRYEVEPRPGLSRARNHALGAGLAPLVAWLDDDEVADPWWAAEITRAFADRPDVQAASGLVLPAELATPAQVWFEQFGGHSKGRGLTPAEFSPATRREQHPLFPLPPFGVGANMAFRTQALRRYGFDEALGAGTATQGGEDTKIFTQLLLDGATTRYWPTAVTRHYHRRDPEALARQLRGYGVGLTAYYTACLLDRPTVAPALLGLAGRGLRTVLTRGGERESGLGPDFPREMLSGNRRGMLVGPATYLRTRLAQRRRDHSAAIPGHRR